MPGQDHDVEFDGIEEGNASPYDEASDGVQDDGADEDA
jgi:hypothetical protein